MPNALTLDDMSPRLRKVVGRESPRVTSTEEPDGGNLLVRIWRGAGVGNLPAYSTTAFLFRCLWERTAGAPPPGLYIASMSRCLRLQVSALARFGVRLQGAPGARALERAVVAGRGGTTAHGSAQVQHARRRRNHATGRGLVERKEFLASTGRGNRRGNGRQLEMPQDTRDH